MRQMVILTTWDGFQTCRSVLASGLLAQASGGTRKS